MGRVVISCAAIALSGLPALAEDVPPPGTDWKALLITTIESNGCAMNEEQAEAMLPGLGFSPEWTLAVVQEMVAEGSAVLDESTYSVVVKTEKCP